jgi:hypothetical protein
MHKNATKCNKTQSKWCINKHGASKIIDTFETYHYGIRDPMYYVREKGKGMAGMDIIDRMSKVEEMLRQYEIVKVLNLIVIKQGITTPADINLVQTQAVELNQPAILSVDKEGLTYISDDCNEGIFPVDLYYSDVLYLGTQ